MAMIAGNADLNTGLAGSLFTQLKTLTGAQSSGPNSPMAQFCNALATAIVSYVQQNATLVIRMTDAGWQQASGAPTLAPASNVTVPAGIVQ